MTRSQFFQHFDLLADQPDAVARMRELILELAVRGRLIPQNPKDETAQALLERVATAAKTRGRGSNHEDVNKGPFPIPQTWAWVKLPRVLKKLTDGTHHSPPNGTSGDFMYVTAKNIKNDGVLLDGITYVSKKIHDEIYSRCDPSYGDVLYIKDGATTGIATINQIKEPFSMLSSVALLKPSEAIFNRYLLWAMRSPFFYSETRGAMKGAAITRVTLSVMGESLLPIPPLAEQRRIVAKVDELMALCDELAARQQARHAARAQLQQSALHHLTTPSGSSRRESALTEPKRGKSLSGLTSAATKIEPDAFRQDAAFVLNRFSLLTETPEDIPQLRQAILQLAVQGRLVPQNPKDGNGSSLLSEIQKHKERLLADKKIKVTKSLPVIDEPELRHSIPPSWCWARLADICELITDGTHQTPKYTDTGRMFLSAQNVKPFRFMPEKHRFVSEADYAGYIKNRKPEYGDILLTRVGAGIGEAAVIDQQLDFAIYVSVALIRPARNFVDPYYMVLWLNSPHGSGNSREFTYGVGVSQGNLNLGQIQKFVFPLPPLAEQKRIVARVAALLRQCDALEAQLRQSRTLGAHLLDSTLHHLLAA